MWIEKNYIEGSKSKQASREHTMFKENTYTQTNKQTQHFPGTNSQMNV